MFNSNVSSSKRLVWCLALVNLAVALVATGLPVKGRAAIDSASGSVPVQAVASPAGNKVQLHPTIMNAPRTVFVQMFEWPWADVARECEQYLGPAGFAAVQVSPPAEHATIKGAPWWERYQPVSYKIESRSGNEAEFSDMILRCARAGVDIYVDSVVNHMAGVDEGVGQAGTPFRHFHYEGLYDDSDFHHCGRNRGNQNTYDDIVDWTDRFEVRNCEIMNLADLATEKPTVRETLGRYLNRLLDLGAAGFRLDASKHVPAEDLSEILKHLKRPAYVVQELMLDPREPITADEYANNGDHTAFDYAYDVGRAFRGRELWKLQAVGKAPKYPSSWDAVVFIENHDLQRLAWAQTQLVSFQTTPYLAPLAHVFMLAWPYGYPQVLSSYRFTHFDDGPPIDRDRRNTPVLNHNGRCVEPWLCEHRNPEVAPMVQFRNLTDQNFVHTDWWASGTQVAFGRGNAGFVAINSADTTLRKRFQTSLSPGWYCNILDPKYDVPSMTCTEGIHRVSGDGTLELEVPPRRAMAFHFAARASTPFAPFKRKK